MTHYLPIQFIHRPSLHTDKLKPVRSKKPKTTSAEMELRMLQQFRLNNEMKLQ